MAANGRGRRGLDVLVDFSGACGSRVTFFCVLRFKAGRDLADMPRVGGFGARCTRFLRVTDS